ncbi:MAG: response regulator [Candidatus Lokiarchaeota archaeon]|nr:response regulator [Candidatus Harpocratesius repetitus]
MSPIIIIVDLNSLKILQVNSAGLNVFKMTLDEIIGKSILNFIAPDYQSLGKNIFESFQQNKTFSGKYEMEIITKHGQKFPYIVNIDLLSEKTDSKEMILFLEDNKTPTELTEYQLNQEKLESIGTLAGGIAHDFNNILAALLGNITLALEEDDLNFIRETLKDAEKSIMRAQNLTTQLLTFATGGAPVKKPTDLTKVITETAIFALRGSRSKCTLDFDHKLWLSVVDANQISQVISNLIINADQSMPNGGEIFLHFHNVEIKTPVYKKMGYFHRILIPPGRYIEIKIRDSGTGIPEKYHSKIFDPYFTTKKMGSGLGLATVYSIVKFHQGFICFNTSTDKNNHYTEFCIYLPAQDSIEIYSENSTSQKKKANNEEKISNSILILEDDHSIQRIMEKLIHHLNYDAVFTEKGEDTIRIYKEAYKNNSPFGLVILDLTIPGGLGGKEVIAELKEYDPKIRAIVASGYSNDPIMANPKKFGFLGVLRKPFTLNQLRTILNQNI